MFYSSFLSTYFPLEICCGFFFVNTVLETLEIVSETNQNFMQTVFTKICVYVCDYTETIVT